MIKAIVIDDEQHCIDMLVKMLSTSQNGILEVVATARSIEEGLRVIADFKPDLIFLDVQIHSRTGFELLKKLPEIDFAIIFTTAYEKFAIQAIKFSALDYLLKPIDEEDLNAAVLKLTNEKSKQMAAHRIDTLLENIQKTDQGPKKIIVPTVRGFEILEIADIVRCESDINYTTIYLRERQKLVVAKTLKEFEELLSHYHFFRVHNSHLVNLLYVKSYNKGKGGTVKLTDGTEIAVSSRRKDDFLKSLSAVAR